VAGQVMTTAALCVVVVMAATWIASLIRHDASIVDPVWPLGFVIVTWAVRAVANGNPARQWLLVAMVTIWGLRLSLYLAWRRRGAPEDFRYRAMRRRWGSHFGLVSLVTVFALQGLLLWVVSLPVQLGQVRPQPGLGTLAVAGVVVWSVGFGFEAVGDAQLARFKADPANAGEVMDRGL